MYEQDDAGAGEPYSITEGLLLNFRHPSDPTVGYIQLGSVEPEDFLQDVPAEKQKPARHRARESDLFEHQYLRYA